jgi:general secretion pathway protein D
MKPARLLRLLLTAAALVALAACELFDPVVKDSQKLFTEGRGEESLAMLDKAAKDKPGRYNYRTEYFRQRDLLAARWLAQGEAMLQAGQLDAAAEWYKRVLTYDAANARANVGLNEIQREQRHRGFVAAADNFIKQNRYAEAGDALRPVLNENPQHREARRLQRIVDDRTTKPAVSVPRLAASAQKAITIELRDVPLRAVFDVISRAIGVNFVFDKDVRSDLRTSIAIQESPAEDVIRLVLSSNQLEQKIVNERTVLVFPRTPQKLQEYQELMVKSFYLANADVKQTANMIRTLVKTRDIFIDEKLNLLIIKDTPNAIRLAERLIAAQDLAEPEVMLEVEVLEISRNRVLELGLRFPDFISASIVGGGTTTTGTGETASTTAGTPGSLTLSEARNLSAGMVRFTFTNPLLLLNLRQTDGSTSVLANPRIRVKNKGKARIHIGDRVPVITTTAAAAGGFVSESVTYLDVGLKLEVEPLIHLDDEVDITVGLEVSNIAREVSSKTSNTLTYQIGTRNASTALRLHDGETQVLAGLINDEDRRSAERVPGVGELPVVGRLFSSTRDNRVKTEIVLLITPRIVRTVARPDSRLLEFTAGTETSAGAPGSNVVPFVAPKPATPPRPQTAPLTSGTPTGPVPSSPGGPPSSTVAPASSASPTVSSPVPAPITAPSPVTPPGTAPPPPADASPAPGSAPTPIPGGTMIPFGGVQPQPQR